MRQSTRQHELFALLLVLLGFVAVGCGGAPFGGGGDGSAGAHGRGAPSFVSIETLAAELEAMSGAILGSHKETFRSILEDSIDKDAYVCLPSPRVVFGGSGSVAPEGERTIRGAMPHYGFYFGPMHYRVRRLPARWEVLVRYAVVSPEGGGALELPDCGLREELGGEVECSGTPYALSGSIDACPRSGVFRAAATPRAVRVLLARWSREAERYYNRDAEAFGIAVHYDLDFVLAEEAEARGLRVDMTLPLSPTCGRTPYFSALRSGWSLPIVAHEVGHMMGLLDEYEALSGVTSLYPKTPFPGAEVSRMGLSMREDTKVLPLHHYLILRRYFCPEPRSADPYRHAP